MTTAQIDVKHYGYFADKQRQACNQSSIQNNQRLIVSNQPHRQTPTMTSRSQLVAIVDDDRSVQNAVKDLMESAGLSAQCFGSAEEFLGWNHRNQTACLVLDIRMPGMSGLELQAKLNAEGLSIPIIFITAHNDVKMKMQAMTAGAVGFLSKPFDDEVLLEKVRPAIKD